MLIKSILKYKSRNVLSVRNISDFKRYNLDLYYLRSPLQWLNSKADVNTLQAFWDGRFCETAFLDGTRHALCTVTHHIADRSFSDLTGLFTAKALESLITATENWPKDAVENFPVTLEQIKVAAIHKTSLQRIADHKFCDIDVQFVTLSDRSDTSTVLMEFLARFYREYTEGKLPEWTITRFKLLNFNPSV